MHRAVRVDAAQALGHDFDLGLAHGAVQGVQLAVAVADTDIVQVKQRNLAYPATGDGFRRPRPYAADADDRHMGRFQAFQAFNAIQAGDACKPRIFCAHDQYPKNRRALWTTQRQVRSDKLQVKNLAGVSLTNVRLFSVCYTLRDGPV